MILWGVKRVARREALVLPVDMPGTEFNHGPFNEADVSISILLTSHLS